MIKRRALALILAAGFVVGSYATDARVAVMGRHSTPWFYRDEVSVFTNPADMSLYPNMIYGSFGWVPEPRLNETTETRELSYNYQYNLARDPHFGAMLSYRFSDEETGPMFSFGAFVNRRDGMIDRVMAEGRKVAEALPADMKANGMPNLIEEPVGRLDLMLGYDFGNGLAIGAGFYGAFQNKKVSDRVVSQTDIFKGSFGINWNIDQGLDVEASVNGGIITVQGTPLNADGLPMTEEAISISDNDHFLRGDVRLFSAVPAINGSFVPQVSLEYINLNETKIIDLNGGVGVNVNIDRGFFWAGLQGVYTQTDASGDVAHSEIGARLSFGIERNIMWDWFLIRVGGKKEVRYHSYGDGTTSNWGENAASNGSDGDMVGLGFGINIDNRLRIDFVASEDLPYTFTNLISGNQYYLFNRVSATYRF